jgi:hypothetical protein
MTSIPIDMSRLQKTAWGQRAPAMLQWDCGPMEDGRTGNLAFPRWIPSGNWFAAYPMCGLNCDDISMAVGE